MESKKKLYEKGWFIAVMLFVFFPVGVVLLWKYHGKRKILNSVFTLGFGIFFLVVVMAIINPPDDSATVTPNQNTTRQTQEAELSGQEPQEQETADSPDVATVRTDDAAINFVRNGTLNFYPSKILGQALAGFLSDITWESSVGDDGNMYVKVSGGVIYHDEPAVASVRYKLNDDDGTFEFYAIEINGETRGIPLYFELIILSFEDEILSIVKNGALHSYPEQALGIAFGNFFEDIEWEVIAAENLEVYVNVSGGLLYGGESARALLQYHVDTMELTFMYNAFEIDGVPQGIYMYDELIELIFE
jgi:hypothetical protein